MTHKLIDYCKLGLGIIILTIGFNTNVRGESVTNTVTSNRNYELEFDSILYLEQDLIPRPTQEPAILFPDTADGRIFQKIIKQAIADDLSQKSFGDIVQTVAVALLGSPYQAGLLDGYAQETLAISLQKFDCLLFVENVIAIARNIVHQDYSYDNFTQNVAQQRYAQGKMTDYCSRLHYFSHWIADNQERDLVTNITANLGGINITKKLNFMTAHRNSYAQLIKNDKNYQCIAQMEKSLEKLTFNYIPTHNISSIYEQLKPGDIIGIATKIKGLDFTHTGLVYQDPTGNIGLIHASPAGQVVIARDLQYYVQNVNQAIGIVVARPQLLRE